jgi:hypothetical protein
VAALGIVALGLHKYQALRHTPADRKPAIRPVCVSCLFAAPEVLMAAPAVGVNLDRVTGVHSLRYCGALATPWVLGARGRLGRFRNVDRNGSVVGERDQLGDLTR